MALFSDRAPRQQRIIRRRLIVRGRLVLQTPAHLGSGDSEGATDMTLLRDSISDRALLTGASIAGALRNYLRSYEGGFGTVEEQQAAFDHKWLAEVLFGGRKGDDEGYQSPLIVNDALSEGDAPFVELRDGVRIESRSRTPAEGGKYDLELLAAGTTFPLQFELALADLPDKQAGDNRSFQQYYEQRLLAGLVVALSGLERGEIQLGMKKRRGFGACRIEGSWQVWDFDLSQHDDLRRWLAFEHGYDNDYHTEPTTLEDLLITPQIQDRRSCAMLEATLALEGSLLIRAGQDEGTVGPDVRHLHARQPDGRLQPIISGTALAGVLRHRAERIANTLLAGSGPAFVAAMFGSVGQSRRRTSSPGQASRLIVSESIITEARTDLVQNRVSIDRFTGGALDGALFNEQPAFATAHTQMTLRLKLMNPQEDEIAMLLLLLKDLWTGDLPVGGESSIGRGRLRGLSAQLTHQGHIVAELKDDGGRARLVQGDHHALNALIAALPERLVAYRTKGDANDEAA